MSALLVRALERCAHRDDTRLSRVVIDLLGGVPAEGDLWVRARVERPGKQIELVSAEMLALGPDGTPPGRAGQRVAAADAGHRRRWLHAPAPPLRPLSEARSRDLAKDWDRNYVHSLDWRWLTKPLRRAAPASPGSRRPSTWSSGESMTPLERLFAVADCANGIGQQAGHHASGRS